MCMIELKGDVEMGLKPLSAISNPDEERIVEYSTLHSDGFVYLIFKSLEMCRIPYNP